MNSTSQSLSSAEIVKLVCKALDDKKADDLRVLDVTEQSSITDFLVIATGTSEPHLRALRVELEKVLDTAKVRIVGMDTDQGSGWMVVDAFDVMVHLFTTQMREAYRLEKLWKDAVELSVPRLLEQPKAAEPVVQPKVKTKAPLKAKTKAKVAVKPFKPTKAAGKAASKPAKASVKKAAPAKSPAKTKAKAPAKAKSTRKKTV